MNRNQTEVLGEEQAYIKNYDISQYARPSIAADIAAFSILGTEKEEKGDCRKLPEKALKILLIKRAAYPFKEYWALPGGFCRPEEDVEETARRELYEETHINNAGFRLCGIFGETGRDPRGWIISNTFLALMDGEKCRLRADTDAWEAEWFSVELEQKLQKSECAKDYADIRTDFILKLSCSERGIQLKAVVRQDKQFQDFHEKLHYEILEAEGFAFDHAKIIVSAILSLRSLVEEKTAEIFHFMPERFTLTQLQRAMELVQGRKLLTANFRRSIKDYVVETKEMAGGAGHRPAKLFERNVRTFYA